MFFIPSKAKVYQLLYVTQDVAKKPAYTVTTIVVPQRPNFNRLISLQLAYDAPDIDCSPSYGLQFGAQGSAVLWNLPQMALVLPLLQEGPILNIPDYEGSNAAFTVGPQTAYQTLDSIRAALKSGHITGLSSEAKTIMFGYSGGGLATEWASELHPSYASDLRIAGAIIGGPPPNVTKTYLSVNGGTASAINVYAVLGVMNAFPEVDEYLREHLLPEHRDTFLSAFSRCDPSANAPGLNNTDISAFFDNRDHFLHKFKDLLDENGVMGRHGSPDFPLFIYKGLNDEITPDNADVEALVKKLCEDGTSVRYRRFPKQDHAGAMAAGLGPAWAWMTNVFNGVQVPGCRQSDLQPEEPDDELLVDGTSRTEDDAQNPLWRIEL
jgi:triacylglycerol lipase